MKHMLYMGLVVLALGTLACRQGDPAIDPKTPPNSPLPTKIERPEDPKTAPKVPPKDAGASAPGQSRAQVRVAP